MSELTGSIPVVTIGGEEGPADADSAADADGRPDTRTKVRRHHGHEAEPTEPEATVAPEPELVEPEPETESEYEPEPVEPEPVVDAEPDAASCGTAAVVEDLVVGTVSVETVSVETDTVASEEESVSPVVADFDDQPTTVQDAVPDNLFTGPGHSFATVRPTQDRTDTQRADEVVAAETASPSAPVAETTVGEPTTDAADAAGSTPVVPSGNEVLEYEDDSVSWPALLAQSALAVIVGVLIFFGFTLLWDNLGTVMVLVMALVVTFVCVGVVHALLRHRDTLLLVLTFVVGIALTVGPRLIMSL